MSPVGTSVNQSSTGKRKPHKISLACNFCRARKRKCDGVRPVCGYCQATRNETCKFDVHSDKRRPASRYIFALESRIKQLEKVIRETPGASLPPETFEATDADEDRGEPCNSISDSDSEGCHIYVGMYDTAANARLPEDSGASVEAIIDMGRLRISKTDEEDTMNEVDSSNCCYRGPSASCFPSCLPARLPNVGPTVDLFKDEMELALLNRFWLWQDLHFMVVERSLFLKHYNDGERDSEWVSPMLVDMMLATGEQFGYAGGSEGRSVRYAERATLGIVHELARPRMATIQALQLISLFQIGCGKIGAGWSLIGLAATLSSRLGLHLDSTELVTRGKMTPATKGARDLAFWGVFILDRLFSIIMGVHSIHTRRFLSARRPPGSISASKLPCLTLVGGEPDEGVSHHGVSPAPAWYTHFRDLCDIVETILLNIYDNDASRSVTEDYNLVVKNATIMKIYLDDLPANANADNCTQDGSNPHCIRLHVLINLFTIMMNRPFIGPHRTTPPPPTSSSTAEQSAPPRNSMEIATEKHYRSLAFSYCRTAALRIVTLVGYLMHAPYASSVYDIFGACTILLLSPQDPEAMQALRTGLEYLNQMERTGFWPSAAKDARGRIWALAKRWNVKPLLDERENTDSNTGVTFTSTTEFESTPAPIGCIDPWSGFSPMAAWGTTPNTFSGPDAALFATYSSTELGSKYGDLGMAAAGAAQWDPSSWDFIGLQEGQLGARFGEGAF